MGSMTHCFANVSNCIDSVFLLIGLELLIINFIFSWFFCPRGGKGIYN